MKEKEKEIMIDLMVGTTDGIVDIIN